MSKPKFRVGQRVRLSPLGRERNLVPKTRTDCSGVVTKIELGYYPKIRWDGQKIPKGYHPAFIAVDRRRRAP